jgi:hypothetical protein
MGNDEQSEARVRIKQAATRRRSLEKKPRTKKVAVVAASPTNSNNDENISEILPSLYLGNDKGARNRDGLRSCGITHVLNVSRELANHYPLNFEYMRIKVVDEPSATLDTHFRESNQFIEAARRAEGKTFVHCAHGMSRSATMVIVYCMVYKGWTLLEALNIVRKKRSVVKPNNGFMRQLILFEKAERGVNTIPIDAYLTKSTTSTGGFAPSSQAAGGCCALS